MRLSRTPCVVVLTSADANKFVRGRKAVVVAYQAGLPVKDIATEFGIARQIRVPHCSVGRPTPFATPWPTRGMTFAASRLLWAIESVVNVAVSVIGGHGV